MRPNVVISLCLALALAFMALDLAQLLGVAAGIPYILVVLVSGAHRLPTVPLVFAMLSTLLIGVGWLASQPAETHPGSVAANRLVAIAEVWAVAGVLALRRRSRDALEESETRFHGFFSDAAVGMAQPDSDSGRLLQVNQTLCQITGYSAEELAAKTLADLTPPEEGDPDDAGFARAAGDAEDKPVEKRVVRKDGETIWVRVHTSPIVAAGGAPRVALVAEDVTERVRTLEALRASEERRRQVEQRKDASRCV